MKRTSIKSRISSQVSYFIIAVLLLVFENVSFDFMAKCRVSIYIYIYIYMYTMDSGVNIFFF